MFLSRVIQQRQIFAESQLQLFLFQLLLKVNKEGHYWLILLREKKLKLLQQPSHKLLIYPPAAMQLLFLKVGPDAAVF